ncbi:hypothetical protein ACI6QG_18260 [Roseococcus sp. DSY-14]|uniref:hypothetical protein n=1 Tax=Roseococcus sp. DSY-14 TaxID=3369650 RepID=UPI00387AC1DE
MAAHADWSAHPGKRWVSVARRDGAGWLAQDPAPVGDPAALAAALLAGAPAVLGLDVPLGVPRGWAAGRPEPGFVEFLRGRAGDARFFAVAPGLDAVSPAAPFYPARGVRGMTRAAHAAALGLDGAAALSRWCDRATAERPAGAPVFWTLGANQSGKAAIACWRDWLAPALAAGAPYALWPFHGAGLRALLAPGQLVLAEVYPAQALRVLGLRLAGSKRRAADRRAFAPALRAAMAGLGVRGAPGLEAGFGEDAAGEDRLDSLLGLLNLVAVLDGHAWDGAPEDPMVRRWEGWVLGQRAMPR